MRAFKHASATNSKPSITGAGIEGYCKNGTPGDPTSFTTLPIDWTNDLIDEIKALATNDGEVALDPGNSHQINDRLAGAAMLLSAPLGETVTGDPKHTKGNIGSIGWEVEGDFSLAIGCMPDILGNGGTIDGEQSIALKCYGSHIAGVGSILIGASACELVDDGVIAGGAAAPPCVPDGLTNKGILWSINPTTGEVAFADVELTTDKTVVRTVPLSSARPVQHATPWEYKDATIPGGLAWVPIDPATTSKLIVGLPLREGEKLDHVTACIGVDPTDTGKVYGNLYRKSHTGEPVALLASDVEWTGGDAGVKQLYPDTPDPVVDGDDQYFLQLRVELADSVNVGALAGTAGLDHVRLEVLISEI